MVLVIKSSQLFYYEVDDVEQAMEIIFNNYLLQGSEVKFAAVMSGEAEIILVDEGEFMERKSSPDTL